jgi:vancomycin resistance protein VanJ
MRAWHAEVSRLTLLPVAAIALTAAAVAVPQRAGPVAAFAAVAPLAYGGLVLALLPLAVLRRDAVLAIVVAASGVLASLVYGPSAAPPQVSMDDPITFLTWNLHGEAVAEVGLAQAIGRWHPDIIVLQEAPPDAADLLPPSMEAFHHPEAATPPCMLLATRLPIMASGSLDTPASAWDRPRAFWLTLDTGGRPLTFIGAHLSVPFPFSSLPCPYCPTLRDAQVKKLAVLATERQAAGESVVVAGDLNLTEREVAFDDLAGLTDVARGGTWRPLPINWLPPLLRLDYVLAGAGVGVASAEVDCAVSSSDHCPLAVRLALP